MTYSFMLELMKFSSIFIHCIQMCAKTINSLGRVDIQKPLLSCVLKDTCFQIRFNAQHLLNNSVRHSCFVYINLSEERSKLKENKTKQTNKKTRKKTSPPSPPKHQNPETYIRLNVVRFKLKIVEQYYYIPVCPLSILH